MDTSLYASLQDNMNGDCSLIQNFIKAQIADEEPIIVPIIVSQIKLLVLNAYMIKTYICILPSYLLQLSCNYQKHISLSYILDTLLYTGCGFHSSSHYNDNCLCKGWSFFTSKCKRSKSHERRHKQVRITNNVRHKQVC